MTRRLFFYGTLMSDGSRGHVLRGLARPVGRGTIRGDLFDVAGGAFPAFVTGAGVVHGEVWEAPTERHLAAALRITDAIEGYRVERPESSLYVRVGVPLLTADGEALAGETVQTYRWNAEQLFTPIEGGRWVNSRRGLVRA